jgi:hypothetical protein
MKLDDKGVEAAWRVFCLNHHRSLGFSIMAFELALKAYLQYVKDKNDGSNNKS